MPWRFWLGGLALMALVGCASAPPSVSEIQSRCVSDPEWPSDLARPEALYAPQPEPLRVNGTLVVCVELQIDETGRVSEVTVLETNSKAFAGRSAETLKTWRFEPARRGTTPVTVPYRVTVVSRVTTIGVSPVRLPIH